MIEALDVELVRTNQGIIDGLASFDPVHTPASWHRILQGVEELFNFATEPLDDEAAHDRFVRMPLATAVTSGRNWIVETIRDLYDGGVEDRVMEALELAFRLSTGCRMSGYPLALATVGDAAGYFQTRRRRIVAFLYVMPRLCQGTVVARTAAEIMPILALVEIAAGPMTDLAQMRMMARVFEDYSVKSDGVAVLASRDARLLDTGAMDPERVSLLDMIEHGVTRVSSEDGPAERRLLSKAEVRMQIDYLQSGFAEFDLAGSSFGEIRDLVSPLLAGPESYVITIPVDALAPALDAPGGLGPQRRRALLIHEGDDYATAVDSYQPFVRIDDAFVSNVNLLTRFLNDYKNVALARQKRFQIRSGFLFEKKVRAVLEAAGFTLASFKRIDRREFDLVATRQGEIHNFQCKNTFIDARLIEKKPERYARLNRTMVGAYRRAITKEMGREHLLKAALGLNVAHHYVVSRFPVLTDDPAIIPFLALEEAVARL
ncbi:hypothetical protein [Brevundimonas diminuta]|uniref:hypothetical protein n=1 Tax=Brevundimonas diminuta TaxID=293 RepID=UPI0030F53D18